MSRTDASDGRKPRRSAAAVKARDAGRTGSDRTRGHAPSDGEVLEAEFSTAELRDFLSADLLEVPADPAFKLRLREKLWELVRSGALARGPSRIAGGGPRRRD